MADVSNDPASEDLDEFYQYRTVWFPWDRPSQATTPTKSLKRAEDAYRMADEKGWYPILEKRLVGGWTIEKGSLGRRP